MSGIKFPAQSTSADQILDSITEMQKGDANWRRGRLFSLIYHAESDLEEVTRAAYMSSFPLNALSDGTFPSLARMEADIVGMTADLLGQAGAPGSLTSGGSESNFLALKTARDRMRAIRPEVTEPEVIVPLSAHPSLSKAAGYLGLKVVRTRLDSGQRADIQSVEDSITPSTIVIVASAPSWPHGVVDPIVEMAQLASRRGVMMHVDACVGGFVLPFASRLGRHVPAFDLSVDGVTSISADVHKFGYSSKGASVILYKTEDIYAYQPFDFDDWTGGNYEVSTVLGSRPGGAVAAAWATMRYLGLPGYLEFTRRALAATQGFMDAVKAIDGFYIDGDPQYNLFAFGSRNLDIRAVFVGLKEAGWHPLLQGRPPSTLHLTLTPSHDRVVSEFERDLREVAGRVKRGEISGEDVQAHYN
jgi:glutamate/tyrosine decarboxylase-like PLP-dependent enzyme